MIRTAAIAILLLITSFTSYATTSTQQDDVFYPETALIQLKQKILNINLDAAIQTGSGSFDESFPDASISIGIKKIPGADSNINQYEDFLETKEKMERAKEHLNNVKETYERIKKDYSKGLITEKDLTKAEEEVTDAERNLKMLEEKYSLYSKNNFQISTKIRNGLLKLLN